jgi:hypothetical protein
MCCVIALIILTCTPAVTSLATLVVLERASPLIALHAGSSTAASQLYLSVMVAIVSHALASPNLTLLLSFSARWCIALHTAPTISSLLAEAFKASTTLSHAQASPNLTLLSEQIARFCTAMHAYCTIPALLMCACITSGRIK